MTPDPTDATWLRTPAPDVLSGDGLRLVRRELVDPETVIPVVEASLAGHLADWMPWAEPFDAAASRRFLRGEDGGPTQHAYVVHDEAGTVLGTCGLIARIGPAALEIGYWVRKDRTREGIATRAARLVTAAAFALPEVDRVEIHHDAANAASRGVPERLGYTHVGTYEREPAARRETGTVWVWALTRGAFTSGR